MSRPAYVPIDREVTGWVSQLNEAFASLLDAPFPPLQLTSLSALSSAFDPKLYKECFALSGNMIYISDGTVWKPLYDTVPFIADLDSGTATLSDIVTAYNNLLAALRTAKWIN